MAKAKFGLNDILNAKSRAAAAGRVEDYEEIYLSPYEVRAAPENTHQSLENIEELADSFFTRRAGAAHGNCKGKRRVSDSGRA